MSEQPAAGKPEPRIELISGRIGYAQKAAELAAGARLELVLFSYALDPHLYGDEGFVEQIKKFLLSSERARLRGLVNSPQSAVRSSNRLIELAKHLSSRIEFRQLPEDRLEQRDEYLICDARHYIHRRDPRDLEARSYTDAPLDARELLKQFETAWQEAVPAREFTDLKI